MAQLAVDNWCNKTIDIADSKEKAEIDSTNVELAEFGIYIIMSLANNICKTCHKWVINNFTKYSNNDLIILLIMNIEAEFTIYREKSLTIYCCQVNKLNCLDITDMDYIEKDVVLLWQKIIYMPWRSTNRNRYKHESQSAQI